MKTGFANFSAIAAIVLVSGCTQGPQSVLQIGGADADVLADLFWFCLIGAVILWTAMNGLFFYVTRLSPRPYSRKLAEGIIIGGGIVFPTVGIGALLAYGLSIMPDQRAPGDGLELQMKGERWWWRVEYMPEGADEPIVAANELRLPTGSRAAIRLTSDKVIHSFWIPSLAGKLDMFPGSENVLTVEPTKAGIYRGQCAEFCGESHALMAFQTVVMDPVDFDAWLEAEARPAVAPEGELAEQGMEVFFEQGCGACHAVRGTEAKGRAGPDLTHVGGRESIGAGILPATVEGFSEWTRFTERVKPGVAMPSYLHLSDDEMLALATYLEGLK